MILPSDTGLRVLLASLGLASSLYKPIPSSRDNLSQAAGLFKFTSNLGNMSQGLSLHNVQASPIDDLKMTEKETLDPIIPSETFADASDRPLFSNLSNFVVQGASCAVEPYESPVVISQTFPPFDEVKANVYRYRQQQGVNLGSWFVHEQWMTPSLFTCASGKMISELDIASGWGSTTSARALLERHWDTFITADDFTYLASIGINTVRLPIGYWNLGPLYCQQTPFEHVADVYQNSWARIVRAINMAADAGLGILIDLHGAVGSQNGQPHSGISDGQTGLFTDSTYQDQTIAVLTFLTQQLATVTNVVGIQLLNEPQNVPQLTDFYTRALDTLRQVSPEAEKMPFYIHDGFDLQRFDDYISARKDFIVQDHHSYFVFTPADNSESADDHTKDIAGPIAQSLSVASQNQRNNLVIDEWSCALTPDSLAKEQDPESARSQFCQGQMQVYSNSTAGWSFWSYNLEDCASDDGWCFKHAVGKSLPPTFFSYSRQANGSGGGVLESAILSTLTKMQLPDLSEVLRHAAQADSTGLDASAITSDATPVPRSTGASTGNMSSTTYSPGSSTTATSSSPSSTSRKRGHRFTAIHSRRQSQSQSQAVFFGVSDTPVLSATQRAIAKGYSDGFLTAKIFGTYRLSKLGFVGQYVEDSLKSLGPTVIEPGKESYYREWFRRSLADSETMISNIALTSL